MTNALLSLRSRLILLILTAIIPAFVLIVDSAGRYREQTAAQIKHNILVAARTLASEHDQVLDNAHEFLVTVSRVPQIREKDRVACHRILAGLLEPRYADLALSDLSGNPLCTALSTSPSLVDLTGPHHKKSVQRSEFTVGNIRRIPSPASMLLDVSYPMLERPGVPRGVVSAAINLSWVNRLAVDTHLQRGASFSLINRQGNVLLRYPAGNEWIGHLVSPDAAQWTRLTSSSGNTFEATGFDGIPRLFALSPLKNPVDGQTVYAAVDLPLEVAFSKTREILVQQLIALGVLSVLILGSTWFGTEALVLRRIRDIVAATRKMAAGNLRARTALTYDSGELGQMARAFDNLAETLEKREAEALQSADQIHQQRRQQEALYDLNRGITSTLDVAEVLSILLDHLARLFPSYTVAVSWLDGQSKVLQTIACRGPSGDEHASADFASEESLPLLVLQRQSQLAVADGRAQPHTAELAIFRRHGCVSYLGLPMTINNQTLGVLSFYGRTPHEFSPDEITFLNALVNEAAFAIHNSQLFEQTRRQASELEKSNKIKDEFLGVMSHELRTPLNIILNYSEALSMGTFGKIPSAQLSGIDKIRLQAIHLLSLINGILEITKIESGTVILDGHPLDLRDFMAELQSDYMLQQTDLALIWENNGHLPVIVTDRTKLKQILTNLINNAIKFTERGSVTIATNISSDGGRVQIQVKDTGPGIPEELLPSVFDKFRQIDSATTRNYSGAGLGLYIVKNFVTLLGGTIDVQSKVGSGSTFTVSLPVAQQSETGPRPSLAGLPNSISLS